MLVLGIDPGIATTGYGLVTISEEGNLSALDFGVILTPAHAPMPQRLLQLHQQLRQIILQYHPQFGAVEKLFFQRNVRTAMAVGQSRGICLLCLAEEDIPVAEYTPLEVKQAVVGYGQAEKKQVQQMVKMLLRLSQLPHPDDAADALAIAICCLHNKQFNSLLEDNRGTF